MDEIALRKALVTLQPFAANLPKGVHIEKKFVDIYHSLLTDVARETGHNMDYFRIPDAEVTIREAGGVRDLHEGWEQHYTEHPMCDRAIFMIKLDGAMRFIASLLEDPGKRIIGFVS
jgi:hypothetical protein